MPLSPLTLTVTSGIVGRPFTATIAGKSAGSTIEIVNDGTPGFGTVNGRVTHSGLPYDINTVVLRETLPGEGTRDSRIDILADGVNAPDVNRDRWAGDRGQATLTALVTPDARTLGEITGPDRSAEFADYLFRYKYQDIDLGVGYNPNPASRTGGWLFGKTPVQVPFGTSLKGHGVSSQIFVSPQATGPIFGLNTDGAGVLITTASGSVGPGLGNARVTSVYMNGTAAVASGNNLDNAPAFEVGASYTFENCEIYRMQTLVRQPSGSYLDQLRVLNCKVSEQPDGSRYAVEWDAPNRRGDGVSVDGLHMTLPMAGSTMRPRAVSLTSVQGAQVVNGLNGDHRFVACLGLTFRGFHGENGKVEVASSTGEIAENQFWMRTGSQFGVVPLQFQQSATIAGQIGGSMFVHDNLWICQESPAFLYDTIQKHMSMTPSSGRLRFDRNFLTQYVSNQGAVPIGNFGILTGHPVWDAYSHLCSIGCEMDDRGKLLISHDVLMLGSSIPGLQGSGNSAPDAGYGAWDLTSGTYYFQIVKWIDKNRAIGRTGTNVVSLALTQGGPAPRLNIDAGDGPGMVSLFFGTSNGQFDRVIDIPYVGGSMISTKGNQYLNYPVQTRAAGPVDAVSNIQPAGFKIRPGDASLTAAYGRVEVWNLATTMPNRGAWNIGDKVLNIDGSYWFRLTASASHILNTDWVLKAA